MLKVKPIDNGFEIIEGLIPEGKYYCYGGYIDMVNVKGTLVEIYLDKNRFYVMELCSTKVNDSLRPFRLIECKQHKLLFVNLEE